MNRTVRLRDPLTLVWAVLTVGTLLSAFTSGRSPSWSVLAVLIVMLIAGIKAHLVVAHFMELRHAPVQWRLVFEGWIVVNFVTTVVCYLGSVPR